MQVELTSTSKVVTFEIDGAAVPARIWEGRSERGLPVMAFITRITPARPHEQLTPGDLAELEHDLAEQQPPSAVAAAIPMRMFLD